MRAIGSQMPVDLEKFFDRVDHDILMNCLRKRIAERVVIRLVRAYLDAGTLINGVIEKSRCGAPQGDPLSPLRRTCCWTKWIENLNAEVIASCAMPTMRVCMDARAQGCWRAARRHAGYPPPASGVPTKVSMKLTGHKTVAMFMHYVHTEDKPVRDAAELVANRRLAITGSSRPAEARV